MNSPEWIKYIGVLLIIIFASCSQKPTQIINNPIIDGYYADPSVVQHNDTFFIYATIDPWGGEELGVFTTTDFIHFNQQQINWPTKKQCTSPTSRSAKVWAPSVVKAPDKLFYMYVSVGSEVWAGVAEHPLGPWKNAKDDASPLIKGDFIPGFHMIDAECFVDDDNRAYLYWGSGWDWVNGKCFVVELNKDMITFKTDPLDVTPDNYFEAPFMIKRNDVYYLMYSNGKAIDATYNVRYATSDSPMGPFSEASNSPVLKTSSDSTIYGPGHHAVFKYNHQDYILYHRIYPQKERYVLRQLCIDSLNFDENGFIKKINPKGVGKFTE